MIVGFILGILIGLILFLIGMFIVSEFCDEDGIIQTIVFVVTLLLAIGSIIIGVLIGINLDNYDLKKDINGYTAIKDTYESAIVDTNLTSLERLQIVDTAISENAYLARRKVTIDAWWNFAIKEELKDELKALEPIGTK